MVGQRSSRKRGLKPRSGRERERSRRVGEKKTAGSPFVFAVIVDRPGSQYTYFVINVRVSAYLRIPSGAMLVPLNTRDPIWTNPKIRRNSTTRICPYMHTCMYLYIQSGISIQYQVDLKNKI